MRGLYTHSLSPDRLQEIKENMLDQHIVTHGDIKKYITHETEGKMTASFHETNNSFRWLSSIGVFIEWSDDDKLYMSGPILDVEDLLDHIISAEEMDNLVPVKVEFPEYGLSPEDVRSRRIECPSETAFSYLI